MASPLSATSKARRLKDRMLSYIAARSAIRTLDLVGALAAM
jgi:hypothetical protein